jgi:hypothetical protein
VQSTDEIQFEKLSWLKTVTRTDVSLQANSLAAVLFNYADVRGDSFLSDSILTNEGKLSDKGMRKGLNELKQAGLIAVSGIAGHDKYRLRIPQGSENRLASEYRFVGTKKVQRGKRSAVPEQVAASSSRKSRRRIGDSAFKFNRPDAKPLTNAVHKTSAMPSLFGEGLPVTNRRRQIKAPAADLFLPRDTGRMTGEEAQALKSNCQFSQQILQELGRRYRPQRRKEPVRAYLDRLKENGCLSEEAHWILYETFEMDILFDRYAP